LDHGFTQLLMLDKLLSKYKSKKDLVNYFVLTYLDKIISFTLPLAILFIIKDKALYNYVEVVFSYSVLALTIIELGFSNYLFFGYKHAEKKEDFVAKAQVYFKFTLLVYVILGILGGIYFKFFEPQLLLFFVMITIRTLFTFYVNFYSGIYRLQDIPSRVYLVTITLNMTSVALLVTAAYFSWKEELLYFFTPPLVFLLFVLLVYLFTRLRQLDLGGFYRFLKKAITYSWPIILNVLAMNFMNNYAKIYAFGNLSEQEMVQISYIMRIGLIIQLTHTSFLSFYSKMLFMDVKQKFNFHIFKQYNLIIFLSILMVFTIAAITNFLFSSLVYIPMNMSTVLFILYIVLWCYIAYLELYFGVLNANRKILMYSIIASIVYISLLKLSSNITLFKLSFFMIISAVINLGLAFLSLNKAQIFKHSG
jgi:hypothetical protein